MKNGLAKLSLVTVFCGVLFAGVSAFPTEAKADGYFYCNVSHVLEYSSRIHVYCSNSKTMGSDTIRYIAIKNNNDRKADRFTSQATAAFLSVRGVRCCGRAR